MYSLFLLLHFYIIRCIINIIIAWGTVMKIYEHGDRNNKTIICLPGNFMTHRQFENLVPLMEENYHMVTVSFDGYDETGETVYTTGAVQAEKLAQYIKNEFGGKADLIYAESLGSIPAAFLTQYKDLDIGGFILSGAEYMNYGVFNNLAVNLFAPMTYKMMSKILSSGDVKFPAFLKIKMGIDDDTFRPMLKQACQTLTLETTKNTFFEATKFYPEYMSRWRPDPSVCISCWYGEREMNMKKAVKHLKRAFPNIDIHPFKNLGHGEIMTRPEFLAQELIKFIENI